MASDIACELPPCPLMKITPCAHVADLTSSTKTSVVVRVPIDNVPLNPECSPLAVTVTGGARK